MTRQKSAQGPPATGLDLSGFPAEPCPGALVRAHSTEYGAWYFASDGGGRFDLPPPRGTCYASTDIEAAVRERLGLSFVGQKRVPSAIADGFAVTELYLPSGTRPSAAISARGAEDYGITGELDSMDDYAVPQRWANAFDAAGFGSIHYRGRFSHTAGIACWALFGEDGAAAHAVGDSLTGREACEASRITVMPPPPTNAALLNVIRPPLPT